MSDASDFIDLLGEIFFRGGKAQFAFEVCEHLLFSECVSCRIGKGSDLRLVYLLEPRAVALNGLRAGTPYRLEWFNPVTGIRQPASELIADTRGDAVLTPPEDAPHDWAALINKLCC